MPDLYATADNVNINSTSFSDAISETNTDETIYDPYTGLFVHISPNVPFEFNDWGIFCVTFPANMIIRSGYLFYDSLNAQSFIVVDKVDNDDFDDNTWFISFNLGIVEDWQLGEPFLYRDRWYVIMPSDRYNPVYRSGESFYSEREEREFILGREQELSRFGTFQTFRITWEDSSDYDSSSSLEDGFTEEREDNSSSERILPVISTNIGRNVPLVSFEQEFSGNGEYVTRELYEAGLAYNRYVDGYHMSEARHEMRNSDRICYVETDSSCGYELIFSKINLRDIHEIEKVSEAQKILKRIKDQGDIRLSARCGFHIHVDVSDWGMKEIVSAYHLWNYLEDTIFRFASAFWSSHRDEEVGGGYSTPVPKGHIGRVEIANRLMERRDALNFSHILRAKGNCHCGAAIYEDWANCSCNLNQPTLEFRVFNATLNQRKIRAYAAFCVGFVNIAKKREHDPVSFPEMRWRGTNVRETVDEKSWENLSVERMRYILEKFPLTLSERKDIEYCFRNSSLELAF